MTPTPLAVIRRIPFAVASLVDTCTKPGSCEREIIQRVYDSIRADVDRYTAIIEDELREAAERIAGKK